MAFLSSLLNPEPNAVGASKDDQDSPSQATSSLPAAQHDPDQPRRPSYPMPTSATAHDAANSLATLSSSAAPPPAPWTGLENTTARSPTDVATHSDIRRSSVSSRRLSAYGEAGTTMELPHPSDMTRNMSSPTLDQYHVPSRSPEQYRRPSYPMPADQHLTLPPIHSVAPAASAHPQSPEESALGQDSSVLVQDTAPQPRPLDTTAAVQYLADHREPDYTRQEPTTSQIRCPDPTSESNPVEEKSPPTEDTARSVDALTGPSPAELGVTHSSPATNSPITILKQEDKSRAQSPLRESSVPVPSTETAVEMPPKSSIPKKRPPKSAGKKGTASTVRREPPAKKRKTDSAVAATATASKRSGTPSLKPKPALANAKRVGSTAASVANSSPAPRSVRTTSTPPRSVASADLAQDGDAQYSEDEEEDEEQGTPDPDAELYCLCRRPDTGTFMIGCDGGCDDWFHGRCVGIAERDRALIDRYMCPRCVDKGKGPTTWKRMCRRVGCRMPARVPRATAAKKGKKAEASSKYCSDACGIQFFNELLLKTRASSETSPKKPTSRNNNTAASPSTSNDLGPLGGRINTTELKSLVSIASGVDQFKRVGQGVLSPPATPSPERQRTSTDQKPDSISSSSILTDTEADRIAEIIRRKDATRARHAGFKNRVKFITMLKQNATTIAEARGLKPKDFCGHDPRMTWTEEEFAAWCVTPEGSEALRTGEMEISKVDLDGDTVMNGNGEAVNGTNEGEGEAASLLCTKKRCARHHDWAKLALDDTRFETGENSEVMRALDKEEKEIRQRAGLRARILKAGGGGGSVEVHDEEEEKEDDPEPLEQGEKGGADVDVDVDVDMVMPDAPPSASTPAETERQAEATPASDALDNPLAAAAPSSKQEVMSPVKQEASSNLAASAPAPDPTPAAATAAADSAAEDNGPSVAT